jgi:hypothetical protein
VYFGKGVFIQLIFVVTPPYVCPPCIAGRPGLLYYF